MLQRAALLRGAVRGASPLMSFGPAARLSLKHSELTVVPPGGVVLPSSPPDILTNPQAEADSFSGIEREIFAKRTAKIFQPAKASTSSGKLVATKWRIAFPTPERWTNNLMGWTSTRDPLSNTSFDFNSVEQATAYAEAMGCKYVVVKPKSYLVKPKNYSDNFVWRGPKGLPPKEAAKPALSAKPAP
mmetsp:Transcript_3168/g.7810  ORF Transcript_3168/g.7810 Transcript_3168/m.7810 type:complete len:187 (-) Transcript_3168:305-865(-)